MHLIDEVLHMFCSIDRVLSRPGGYIFLAGKSGIGRRLCVRLLCTMLRLDLQTPHYTKSYSERDFKRDMRKYLELAGI